MEILIEEKYKERFRSFCIRRSWEIVDINSVAELPTETDR